MFIIPAGWKPNITITYHTSSSNTTDGSTHTFNNINIGAANTNRLIVVTCHGESTSTIQISSATIDGGSATIVANCPVAQQTGGVISRIVPTGTTISIAVTWTASASRGAIGVWSISGWSSSTAHDTHAASVSTSTTHTVTLDLPKRAVAIAGATLNNGSFRHSWDVGVERYDDDIEAGGTSVSGVEVSNIVGVPTNITTTHSNDGGVSFGASWV